VAAAKALGCSAIDLDSLPTHKREFWIGRGLLWASSENEAMELDRQDRETERFLQGNSPI
jgi:hypothetical protein